MANGRRCERGRSEVEQSNLLSEIKVFPAAQLFAVVSMSYDGDLCAVKVGSYEECSAWCIGYLEDAESRECDFVVPVRWTIDARALIDGLSQLQNAGWLGLRDSEALPEPATEDQSQHVAGE